jgi:hypothetical protein
MNECLAHFGPRHHDSVFPPRDIDWPLIRSNDLLISMAINFAATSYAMLSAPSAQSVAFADRRRAQSFRDLRTALCRGSVDDTVLHGMLGALAGETHVRSSLLPAAQVTTQIEAHVSGIRAMLQCKHEWNFHFYHPAVQFELQW